MSYSQRQLTPVDGPVPDSPRPLYEATCTCLKAFEDCLDFDHDWKTGAEAIMEQESRLFRWGRLTGVFREGGDCLDARLSHHKHVSNRMLAFLYNIANQIASGKMITSPIQNKVPRAKMFTARLGDDADEPYRSSLRIPAIEAAIDDLFCLSDEIQRWVEKWPQLDLVRDDETMTDTAEICQEQAGAEVPPPEQEENPKKRKATEKLERVGQACRADFFE
ncbi:hypothetical protein A9K55_002191 [Cordyceps militaris]|uniref:Uncharacterized protein n=1 Tax=Cordyceps militaris TaxID=73501 RepID=A0A2H4SQX8_CORMI|nr:hypothetical protein A9K55_002191 [Cordyceps militaris]